MKVSFNWLCDFVPGLRERGAAAAAEALTRLGFEVESLEETGRELSGVVVAEIVAPARPHPNADKLRVVRVRAGGREEDVVCGAPNVPGPGSRVVWAQPGARLPGGHTITAREVRGVMSPGMLASEPELGIGDKGDGILILSTTAPEGVDFAAHFGAADSVLEINVTPNRPDALSHIGIARELAAFFGAELTIPAAPAAATTNDGPTTTTTTTTMKTDVRIVEGAGCPRYQARFITGLEVAPSPLAMRLRLTHCGVRPISNLVDVTNYILLELGHPLHAFDFERVQGEIVVRRAHAGERMTTLDGQERTLLADDIVITDARGPVALAGVMGGASSEVAGSTRSVLLEAATFEPKSVRRTSRRLGLISEASYRYERGVDAEGIPRAAERAAAMMASLGGGAVVNHVVDRYPEKVAPRQVRIDLARLRRVAGKPLDANEAACALRKVASQVDVQGTEARSGGEGEVALVATIPTFRPDLALPEDLVEEILRLGDGYSSRARPELVLTCSVNRPNPEAPSDRARDLLAAAGLSEVVTWGFVPRARLAALSGDGRDRALGEGIVVSNPISADYEVMRTSLLPGLVDAAARNLARGVPDLALFEVGPVIRRAASAADEPVELEAAAGILAGRTAGWLKPGEAVDFFDAKAAVEELLRGFGAHATFGAPSPAPAYLHPGVSAEIRVTPAGAPDGTGSSSASSAPVGVVGELHPVVARRLGLEARALVFELFLAPLAAVRAPVRAVPPPRFPAVARDVSFWIAEDVTADAQRAAFATAGEPLLRELRILEDFRDPKYTPAGKKGMLWSMTYRADDRTLTDADADAAHGRVVAALKARFDVAIR